MAEAAASQPAAAEAKTIAAPPCQHEKDQFEPTSARASEEGPLELSNLPEVQAGGVDAGTHTTLSKGSPPGTTTVGGDEVLERARELMAVSPLILFGARGSLLREACYSVRFQLSVYRVLL